MRYVCGATELFSKKWPVQRVGLAIAARRAADLQQKVIGGADSAGRGTRVLSNETKWFEKREVPLLEKRLWRVCGGERSLKFWEAARTVNGNQYFVVFVRDFRQEYSSLK